MNRSLFLALLSLCALAPAASAQSIFSARGFGVPVAPIDPRAQALGGIGIGLLGQDASMVNPAEIANHNFRGAVATLQSSSLSADFGAQSGQTTTNRFPLLRVIYPIDERLSASVGYGGFLDQTWSVVTSGFERIGADSVAVRDASSADGGLAQLRVGLAYSLAPSFAVGIDGGIYTGKLDERLSRTFGEGAPAGIDSIMQRDTWTQRAPLISAGFRWDPAQIFRLAESFTWAGTLARELENKPEAKRSFQLPLQAAAGASAILAPGLMGTVSTRWAGWSRAADDFDPAFAPVDTWEYGAGLEWTRMTLGSAAIPIRFGYHRAQLPFRFQGVTPTESAATVGLGLELARTAVGPLATIDATLDRGRRTAAGTGLNESFWRMTLGIGVFGR
jgi:hypothetical protein